MTHRFPIKEIARQAGMGTATVDRVLNNRAHVSPQTRNRVKAAIAELELQEQQLAAKGRRLFVDIVIEAPQRFSREVRRATEAVLPQLGMAVFRPRFVMQEVAAEADTARLLERLSRGRSQGVCLKARDVPALRDAVDRLQDRGIPVVTLVTDMPHSKRIAYAGIDNANAGRTAAYLLAKTLPSASGRILTTRSRDSFYGEAERFAQFRQTLAGLRPDLKLLDLSSTGDLSDPVDRQLDRVLRHVRDLRGVYSMGGGNEMILRWLEAHGRGGLPYVAHDLDLENRRLLAAGKVDFVLHHDLERDMRNALQAIAAYHGLGATGHEKMSSEVQIITPYNRAS